jgi:hypothetical protein
MLRYLQYIKESVEPVKFDDNITQLLYDEKISRVMDLISTGNYNRNGSSLNLYNSRTGDSLLYIAAFDGHYEVVEEMIKRGADINIQNINIDTKEKGFTPLMGSIIYKKTLQLLLDNKADTNIIYNGIETVLTLTIVVVTSDKLGVIKNLIKYGANPNIELPNYERNGGKEKKNPLTPFYVACICPESIVLDVVKYLFEECDANFIPECHEDCDARMKKYFESEEFQRKLLERNSGDVYKIASFLNPKLKETMPDNPILKQAEWS